MATTPILPAHIEQTIAAIAELQRAHQRRATPSQKVVVKLTALVGKPRFVGGLTIALMLWVGLNGFAKLAGFNPADPPPFNYLQACTGVFSVYVAILILITQRHEDQLAEARDQLTLELAILNEQKSAKLIALIEELRRDTPTVPDRIDPEADQLATPSDPQKVFEALRTTAEQAESGGSEAT